MKNLTLVAGVVGLLGTFAGCGGDEQPQYLGDGGTQNRGGVSARAGSKAVAGGEGGASEGGGAGQAGDSLGGTGAEPTGVGGEGGAIEGTPPDVTVTSPPALSDPAAGEVLVSNTVKVTCKAERASAPDSRVVDPAGVFVAILDADGKGIEEKPATPTGEADEFANSFILTTVPGGKLGFRCRAKDVAGREGTATLYSLFDKGPTITVLSPARDSKHSVSGLSKVSFTVKPLELAVGDAGAQLGLVTLNLGGINIPVAKSLDVPNTYDASFNLADTAVFNPTPDGSFPVIIEATNLRTPTAVKSTESYQVLIDSQGPVIAVSKPAANTVIGGNVKLIFTVNDAGSGVDEASVVVVLNGKNFKFDRNAGWTRNNATFTYEFDSRSLTASKVQATIAFGASDSVGNESLGQAFPVYLDNEPPRIDLDPADVRSISKIGECSIAFDPVGEALNDLGNVARGGMFRAFVWDHTNNITDLKVWHYAGNDPATVRLHLQKDPASAPLLVNNDADPECDDIGPIAGEVLPLTAISKAGQPWYMNESASAPSAAMLGCTVKTAPKPVDLCIDEASEMWQVIEHDGDATEPVIYGYSPKAGLECTGSGWELGPLVDSDGWICFAVRGADTVGNVGVSRPLRLCMDDPDVAGSPACAISSTTPPTCTDGCTPAPRWGNIGVQL